MSQFTGTKRTVICFSLPVALSLLLIALAPSFKCQHHQEPRPIVKPTPDSHTNGGLLGQLEADENGAEPIVSDLEAAASSDSLATTSADNPNSHRVVASGWPSTSPMWPSIETADGDSNRSSTNASNWPVMIEPFIFADKPRSVDYSLLLSINKTIGDSLKNHQKPIAVILSFEFYFNFESKVSALPGIKIEIDRKQFRYLEPTLAPITGNNIVAKKWIKFNEQILVTDAQQFDNHDWLKFSLVNRQSLSIVAIRKLKVELSVSPSQITPNVAQISTPAPSQSPNQFQSLAPAPTSDQIPPAPNKPIQPPIVGPNVQQNEALANQLPQIADQQQLQSPQSSRQPEFASTDDQPAQQQQQQATRGKHNKHPKPSKGLPFNDLQQSQPDPEAAGSERDQISVPADALTTTLKPVKPNSKSGTSWMPSIGSLGNPFGRRKKRQVAAAAATDQPTTPLSYIFTCYQRDSCEWRADGSEEIQWSSARMPPSTGQVQNGYYFANSIGQQLAPRPSDEQQVDGGNLLRLSLNQTEAARIKDQNSDHCIELAIYVTERARLKMYRLHRGRLVAQNNSEGVWLKGNLLLSWSPTMINEVRRSGDGANASMSLVRNSLPNSRLPAMENGQNGWTLETICFGDFFTNVKECCLGNCGFGFEMELDESLLHAPTIGGSGASLENASVDQLEPQHNQHQIDSSENLKLLSSLVPEQVIGISLRNEYSIKPKTEPREAVKWLRTWHRAEVEPEENWKLYPRMDFNISAENVTLLNTYDNSHYHLHSSWLIADEHLDFTGSLVVEFNQTLINATNNLLANQATQQMASSGEPMKVFAIRLMSKIVNSKFDLIHSSNTTIEWSVNDNSSLTSYSLDMPITDSLKLAHHGQLRETTGPEEERNLFKIIIEFIFEVKFSPSDSVDQHLVGTSFGFHVTNVSLSDRCYPNPCQFGSCHQNGTGLEDWVCRCDDGKHRGRHCEFGRWCELAHVSPWIPPSAPSQSQLQQLPLAQSQSTQPQPAQTIGAKRSLTPKSQAQAQISAQPIANRLSRAIEGATRISGSDYCQRKLGSGSKCTEIDLPLNDNLYTEDERTFTCSCHDDYYLSDDSKCKQAHPCNSIVCPAIGMICDETKPFNRSQPCVCNEKQDWHLDVASQSKDNHQAARCVRRQCQDIQRDCGFEAHVCLPTLPGERPICKCGPNFALKLDEKTGKKYCQSTACTLPTLNDCQQICTPNNDNKSKPFKCDCHPGYQRDPDDERKCKPIRPEPHCRPACHSDTQICTDFGCKCKQGYLGEGELIVKQINKRSRDQNGNLTTIDYVQSVRCLNVCSLTYAENKRVFDMIESVCPLGLCDPLTFQCRCYDPSSSALVNTKYEPIYKDVQQQHLAPGNSSAELSARQRSSPLCHLRRVCEPDSISYKICRSQGAICVPDYTKAAMFDCICPPSSEKRLYGQGSSSEFTCEPKCSSVKYECLRRQAVCRLVEQDSVRCDCLPGHLFDQHDHKCYLAKFAYAINLIIVNKYYEPESKFHRIEQLSAASGNQTAQLGDRVKLFEPRANGNNNNKNFDSELSELTPQFQSNQIANDQNAPQIKSKFIVDYNQCNITQVIPKDIIEDPYEHDIESYLSYIDQCNERIHQNVKTYHLNSKLAEDLRQSLRQHLRGFTVTTSNSTCRELDDSMGMYLNCTVYLQSNEPIDGETVDFVFNNCDKNGQDDRFCWIKPRLLLKKQPTQVANTSDQQSSQTTLPTSKRRQQLNFRQIIACELDNFCGPDAYSVRLDDRTSMCSCKCPPDIEVVDVRDLERKPRPDELAAESAGRRQLHGGVSAAAGMSLDYHALAAKEICAPRNHCASGVGPNSSFCLAKPGSVCQYDVRLGSRCQCVYPSYENNEGRCVEVAFSKLDDTLIVLIIMLGTGLIVSIAINLFALAKSQKLFSQSKEYPLRDFSTTNSSQIHQRAERPLNRSTGVPNLAFDNDD